MSCFRFLLGLLVLGYQLPAAAQAPPLPRVASGTVRRLAAFPSRFVAARPVDVWLPAGYPAAGRYNVLYVHDGQMLFDSATTWNHREWQLDETLGELERTNRVRPTIVVAIWNTGPARHAEYYPQRPLAYLDSATRRRVVQGYLQGRPQADNYLRFLVQELKPFIDRTFATQPGRAHTFVLGSSMGALISLYALCEYPRVFGGAACLSTHWPGTFTAADRYPLAASFQRYLRRHLPAAATHRLYFDHGTATLDSLYSPHQQAVDALLRQRNYPPRRWTSRVFVGASHSERAWAQRLTEPLEFLLRAPGSSSVVP